MAQLMEPTLHIHFRVKDTKTGVVHIFLGDMTGCGTSTVLDRWKLVTDAPITCKDCLYNYEVMHR